MLGKLATTSSPPRLPLTGPAGLFSGLVTAIIGDVAAIFGCCLGIKAPWPSEAVMNLINRCFETWGLIAICMFSWMIIRIVTFNYLYIYIHTYDMYINIWYVGIRFCIHTLFSCCLHKNIFNLFMTLGRKTGNRISFHSSQSEKYCSSQIHS